MVAGSYAFSGTYQSAVYYSLDSGWRGTPRLACTILFCAEVMHHRPGEVIGLILHRKGKGRGAEWGKTEVGDGRTSCARHRGEQELSAGGGRAGGGVDELEDAMKAT